MLPLFAAPSRPVLLRRRPDFDFFSPTPPCRSNLAQNALTGGLPPEWGELASLTSLDASSNYLSGGLPEAWKDLTSLQEAQLANNNLGVSRGLF